MLRVILLIQYVLIKAQEHFAQKFSLKLDSLKSYFLFTLATQLAMHENVKQRANSNVIHEKN
jgi:hypothetical protein